MHYGNFTKLERKKSPFSLRERYFNTHFLGLWKMRRNDLLIYPFKHRIETTISLNFNLMKFIRKLTFKIGYCLNSVKILHVATVPKSSLEQLIFTENISFYFDRSLDSCNRHCSLKVFINWEINWLFCVCTNLKDIFF